MYKIEKDDLVYYYGSHQTFIMALESKDKWSKTTLACAVIDTRDNTIVKCRYDIKDIFNIYFNYLNLLTPQLELDI